jgi:hypothetical protein
MSASFHNMYIFNYLFLISLSMDFLIKDRWSLKTVYYMDYIEKVQNKLASQKRVMFHKERSLKTGSTALSDKINCLVWLIDNMYIFNYLFLISLSMDFLIHQKYSGLNRCLFVAKLL